MTITSAVDMRTRNQANAILISVLIVIFIQNDHTLLLFLFERNVNAVTIKPTLYLKAFAFLI